MSKKIYVLLLLISVAITAFTQITIEAEDAVLNGVQIATSISGYTGTGYVTGMDNDGESITATVTVAEAGFYACTVRYNGSNGDKYQDVYVNGNFYGNISFPATATYTDRNIGTITLNAGANTFVIQKSWGWTDFDAFSFTLLPPPDPIDYSKTTPYLIDTYADGKTQAVYNYLRSNYGVNIISGQTDYFDELKALANQSPVVQAYDFASYTVGYPYLWDNSIGGHSFGWEDNGTTQAAIDWYNATGGKGIVSFQWHWHSPTGGVVSQNNFYTANTSFDVTKAVQSGTAENIAILRDIDSIASQLKRLESAGVPVLWRPLHEAGGQWFWWGAKTSQACLALWDIVYERLSNYHAIHNLIWVWSSPEADWYPGNDKVDIIGFDSYPGEYSYVTQKLRFDQLYDIVNGEKIVTMSENGPIPNIDDLISQDAMWCYFSSWNDMVATQNTTTHIQEVYAHERVVTLSNTAITQTIELNSGWNMVSTYNNPLKPTIDFLLGGIDFTIVKSDNGFYKVGLNSHLNSIQNIQAGDGYMLYVNNPTHIFVTGMPLSLPTVSMVPGWNLIGCPYQTNTNFSSFLNTTSTEIIKNFDGFWEPGGTMNSLSEMEPGKGYFIKGK